MVNQYTPVKINFKKYNLKVAFECKGFKCHFLKAVLSQDVINQSLATTDSEFRIKRNWIFVALALCIENHQHWINMISYNNPRIYTNYLKVYILPQLVYRKYKVNSLF